MSHKNRRAYPQAQYDLTPGVGGQPPLGAPGVPPVGATPLVQDPQQQPQFIPAQNQYYQQGAPQQQGGVPPAGVTGVDQLSQGLGNISLQTPYAGQYQASHPAYGSYQPAITKPVVNAPNNFDAVISSLPLNELYPTDLLRDIPPPIHELSLPPPPLVIPAGSTVTASPTVNDVSRYMRSTLNAVPNSSSLLKKSKLPFALNLRPYLFLRDEDEEIPVIEDSLISRCRRCRAYINPFCVFVEDGRRWRCNMCNLQNDVPQGFDFDQVTKVQTDRLQRKELNHSMVEFVAPPAYFVRTPQPLVYVFIIDVSIRSMQNGLLGTVTRTILESLDRIPDRNGRTKISIIGVDQSLHFFTIPPDAKEGEEEKDASLLVVSDIDDVFLPSPDQLLVNLKESRQNIEKLLNNFASFFQSTLNDGFALGPALKSAHTLIKSIGGKVIVFSSSLPTIGEGKLVVRNEEALFNKPKESSLLLPNDSFYKKFAVECNKSQVTIDMFLASSSYQDVATLANLPHYTAGQTHFYPAWNATKLEDVNKLSKEISNHLSMDIQVEAVLRVRGSSGLRMSSFYGNFFNRSSDLCSFPTFPRDQSYVIEVSIDEQLIRPVASIQAAVLHTTHYGERRIRVCTIALPVVKDLKHVFASADQLAIANFYTHKLIEKLLNSSFQDARDFLTKSIVDILVVFKKELVGGNIGSASPLQLSTNLRMLPLLLCSLSKNIAFRAGRVPSDHRAIAMNILGSLPLDQLIQYIYPTVYSLHDMEDECGLPEGAIDENGEETGDYIGGEIVLPQPMNSSMEFIERFGLYLINNGSELFLWVGGDSVEELLRDLFGVSDLFSVPSGKVDLPELDSKFNIRVRNIIEKVRQSKQSIVFKTLYIIKGPGSHDPVPNQVDTQIRDIMALRAWAQSELVEDSAQGVPGYKEYLAQLRGKVYA